MRTTVAALLIATLTAGSVAAAPVPSRGSVDRGSLQQATERRDVSQRLEQLGLTPQQANAAIERLSAEDVHQLATNPQQLRAAGGWDAKTWIAIGMVVGFVIILVASGDEDEPTPTPL